MQQRHRPSPSSVEAALSALAATTLSPTSVAFTWYPTTIQTPPVISCCRASGGDNFTQIGKLTTATAAAYIDAAAVSGSQSYTYKIEAANGAIPGIRSPRSRQRSLPLPSQPPPAWTAIACQPPRPSMSHG